MCFILLSPLLAEPCLRSIDFVTTALLFVAILLTLDSAQLSCLAWLIFSIRVPYHLHFISLISVDVTFNSVDYV